MNNLQRLELETKGINLEQNELIFLLENDLDAFNEYNPRSPENKRNIYRSALSILESIANNPQTMKTLKYEDTSISEFHEQLMNRIDQLERKIRQMKIEEDKNINGNVFMLFGI